MATSEAQEMEALYKDLWSAHSGGLYALLDRSLDPRSADLMLDMVEDFGVGPGDKVLDIGCGLGIHSLGLARRFGCRVVALDSAISNLKGARDRAVKESTGADISFVQGAIRRLPYPTAGADFLWCRDMLVHVRDLGSGLAECARVMKPGAIMLLLTTMGTDLLYDGEASRLFRPIHIVGKNLKRSYFESAIENAGLQISARESIGAEILEYIEERDGRYSREMLRISRMIRGKDKFAFILGEGRYQMALALYYWSVYIMIGKLADVIYTVRR